MARAKIKKLKISKKGWIGILIGALVVVGGYLLLDNFSASTVGTKYIETLPPVSLGKVATYNINIKDKKGSPITTAFKYSVKQQVKLCYTKRYDKAHPNGGCTAKTLSETEETYNGTAVKRNATLFKMDQQTVKDGKVLSTKTLYFFGWYPDPNDTKVVAMWVRTYYTVKDANGKKLATISNNPPFIYTTNEKSALSWADRLAKGKDFTIKVDPSKTTNSVATTTAPATPSSTTASSQTAAQTTTSDLKIFDLIVKNGVAITYKDKVSKNCAVSVLPFKDKGDYQSGGSAKCDKGGTFWLKVSRINTADSDAIAFNVADNPPLGGLVSTHVTVSIKDMLKGGTVVSQASSSKKNQTIVNCHALKDVVTCALSTVLKINE